MNILRLAGRSVLLLMLQMATAAFSGAQAIGDTVAPFLDKPVQPISVTAYQLQKYMMKHIPKPVPPATAEQWAVDAQKLRKHILEDVAFHGWPHEWIVSPPHFEQTAVIETDRGYRLRKFRYEIVPSLYSTAILYQPVAIKERVPAIL